MTSDMPVTRNQVKEERTIFEDADTTEDVELSPPLASSIVAQEEKSFHGTPTSDSSSSEDEAVSRDKQSSSTAVKPNSRQWPSTSTGECVSPEGVTYLLWRKSSSDQHARLYSSDGFSFCLAKKKKKDCRVWHCSRHTVSFTCPASVKELSSGGFVPNEQQHTHPSDKRCFAKVQISKALKEKCDKNLSAKIPEVVKKLVARYSPGDIDNQNFLEELSHNAAKERRRSLKRTLVALTNESGTKKMKQSGGKKIDKKKKKKKRDKSMPAVNPTNSATSADSTEVLPTPQAAAPDREDFVFAYVPRKRVEELFRNGVPRPSASTQTSAESSVVTSHGVIGSLPSTSRERQAETSKLDPDEMFFYSVASEVKELPKLAKLNLKQNILSMVNEALQNN